MDEIYSKFSWSRYIEIQKHIYSRYNSNKILWTEREADIIQNSYS